MAATANADISGDRLHIRDLAPGLTRVARAVGLAGLVAALLLGLLAGWESFFRGYLTGLMFWLSLALGAFFFVVVQHATKAGWSVTVRRIAENFSAAFVPLALLSLVIVVPMIFGTPRSIHHVFPWTDPAVLAHDEILQKKAAYLNVPFFVLRMALYFGIWIWLGGFFYNRSTRQDHSGDPKLTLEMQARSYPAIILYGLSLTFIAFDLLMSLDPHWFSTIFGVYYFSGAAVGFFALLAIVMIWLQNAGRLEKAITDEHYHDVGKLVFAFIVFWAYIAYSQYMLIWYGNLPEETTFYIVRQHGPWLPLSLVLLFGHFFVPFIGLISRIPKRRKSMLLIGAGWVLLMHWCDILWLVWPHAVDHETLAPAGFGFVDLLGALASTIGVGGIYLSVVAARAGQHALIPERDPWLPESLAFENM